MLLLFWIPILLSKFAHDFFVSENKVLSLFRFSSCDCVWIVPRHSRCVDFRTGPCESRAAQSLIHGLARRLTPFCIVSSAVFLLSPIFVCLSGPAIIKGSSLEPHPQHT